jgi:hypothetical protein
VPGTPTSSCKRARAGPACWQATIAQRLARRTHTLPMAIGRTPRPQGFARAMRVEALREGISERMPLMIKFISARMAALTVGEVPVAARRWSYVHPLRPGAEPRGRCFRIRWNASSVTTGAGAEAGGMWGGPSWGCRAARLARVAAVGGASGSASKTRAARDMLSRARWWSTRATVLWGDDATGLGLRAEPPRGDGAGASAPRSGPVQKVPEADNNSASAAPGGACIRQGTGGEGEKVGHGVLDCLGRPRGGTPRGQGREEPKIQIHCTCLK